MGGSHDDDDEAAHAVTVRISHVYDDRIVLTTALTDAVEDVGREIVVPFPAPDGLRKRPERSVDAGPGPGHSGGLTQAGAGLIPAV